MIYLYLHRDISWMCSSSTRCSPSEMLPLRPLTRQFWAVWTKRLSRIFLTPTLTSPTEGPGRKRWKWGDRVSMQLIVRLFHRELVQSEYQRLCVITRNTRIESDVHFVAQWLAEDAKTRFHDLVFQNFLSQFSRWIRYECIWLRCRRVSNIAVLAGGQCLPPYVDQFNEYST